ncbi:MAG: RNA methyltransferase [Bacteroidetes bacterium]|nr:RNA methyltransferase [Bacteroidota bacterium]MBU1114235.1 RNA methyltransferase [Bacteroidota bacterium]MBU1798004.1 RNA methyltransferase [Bacteroidota bacterium]
MQKFKTEKRLNKIKSVVKQRQHSLKVVLENIHDPHNVSAIYRTCDSVGIPKVTLIYNTEEFPKISRVSSSSANKWVESEKYKTAKECFDDLRKDGFKIYASQLNEKAKKIYSFDLTDKVALVFGNEHRGISEEVAELADEIFYIPMRGMIQSLNVSVATAVTLYEAQRQREEKGMYETSDLNEDDLEKMIDKWCAK